MWLFTPIARKDHASSDIHHGFRTLSSCPYETFFTMVAMRNCSQLPATKERVSVTSILSCVVALVPRPWMLMGWGRAWRRREWVVSMRWRRRRGALGRRAGARPRMGNWNALAGTCDRLRRTWWLLTIAERAESPRTLPLSNRRT